MERKPFLYETVQEIPDEQTKVLLLILVKNLISAHKTPWEMTKRTNSESFVIRDDWGKIVIQFAPKELAEQLIIMAENIVQGYKANEKEYVTLSAMWQEAKQKYKSIDRALEKEDENDFRNMPLVS